MEQDTRLPTMIIATLFALLAGYVLTRAMMLM